MSWSFIHRRKELLFIIKWFVDCRLFIVYKQKQVLLQLTSKDFSFVGEGSRSLQHLRQIEVQTKSHSKCCYQPAMCSR